MLDWLVGTGRKQRDAAARPVVQSISDGLIAGTQVATSRGWIPAEQVSVGDQVMTFDDGAQSVTAMTRRLRPMSVGAMSGARPLLSIPVGLIGNRRSMLVPEGQAVIVESDLAEDYLGDPFVAVSAHELLGLPGVRKVLPEEGVVVVTLSFEKDQLVYVEGNALALCPATKTIAPETVEDAIWPTSNGRYHILEHSDAEVIVASIDSEGSMDGSTHLAAFPAQLS